MILNLDDLIIKNKKKRKIHIILTIILSIILLINISLFIFLSNYQIQILMSILGSITSSIISLFVIAEIIFGIYFSNNKIHFYELVLSYDEHELVIDNLEINKENHTVFKNISLKNFNINNNQYFILEELDFNFLNTKKYDCIIKGNYVIGVKDEN